MTPTTALALTALIASIGVLIDCIEISVRREEIRQNFRADLLATITDARWRTWVRTRAGDWILSRTAQTVRGATALLATATLWIAPSADWASVAALVSVILSLATMNRLVFGLDGSDQMQVVVWAALALSSLSTDAAIALIACQALLAYLTSGIAKLLGTDWRSGVAAGRVVTTAGHGSPTIARLLQRPALNRAATWGTVTFEAGLPALLLFGLEGGLTFACIAVLFHLGIAYAMGLNTFVWAFTAALPALVVCADRLTVIHV